MIEALRTRLRGAVADDKATLLSYSRDASPERAMPLAVARPAHEEDVASLVAWARETGTGLVPRGAGTGLSGGSVGSGVVVDLAGLDHLRLRADDLVATVGPGVVNGRLQDALRQDGLFWPPDPSSRPASTVGGNLATNAGGPACLKYGVTRHWVLGLRAVLGTGDVAAAGSLAMKDVAGYDLTGLMIGSEGTLGVITEATLRLLPLPPARGTVLATYDDPAAAAAAAHRVRTSGVVPEALEFVDGPTLACVEETFSLGLEAGALLLSEVAGHPEAVAGELETVAAALAEGATSIETTTDPEEGARLWRARRAAFGTLAHRGKDLLVEDVSVPLSGLVSMVDRVSEVAADHGLEILVMGHAGDGNLHPQFVLREGADEATRVERAVEAIVDHAVSLGGSMTGEHGVGTVKSALMRRALDPGALAAMRAVKAALDPDGVLNPGKMLP